MQKAPDPHINLSCSPALLLSPVSQAQAGRVGSLGSSPLFHDPANLHGDG